jgi:hypothetical protein
LKQGVAPIAIAAGLIIASAIIPQAGQAQDKRDDHGKGRHDPQQQGRQPSDEERQRRIGEERQRQSDYQRVLDQRVAAAQAQQAQLQAQRRNAQYAQQQAYIASLQAQRQRIAAERNYQTDPYFTTATAYRYRVSGVSRETNQYGVEVLRSAVNNGYTQGVQAGRADRQDGRRSNYRATFAYQDANYGYAGQYVAQSDYNYYFRQGFQRGYEDGYASTSRYGSFNNGTGSILSSLLTSILGLTDIH